MPAPAWLRRAGATAPGWRHGWSTGAGPDFGTDPSSDEHTAAAASLAVAAGLAGAAWAHQVHGGTVLRADAPGCLGEADALWTDTPGLGVLGRGADCPLILVAGTRGDGRPLAGMAHASWRSTVAGITPALLLGMIEAGMDPATGRAVICPSAGPCCYQVGGDVRDAFGALPGGADALRPDGDRWLCDLWLANTAALVAAGLPPEAVTVTGLCTICGDDTYPSHRRQKGRAGRFAAVSGIAPGG